jgi:hypothetical protein
MLRSEYEVPCRRRRTRMALTRQTNAEQALNRRVRPSEQYARVQSTLDTGASRQRWAETYEEVTRLFKYRRGEIFRRVCVETFVALVRHGDGDDRDDGSIIVAGHGGCGGGLSVGG